MLVGCKEFTNFYTKPKIIDFYNGYRESHLTAKEKMLDIMES